MARGAPSEHPTAVLPSAEGVTREDSGVPTFLDDRPAVEPPMLRAGERIAGRYLVDGLLGKGGFAEVYRVRDEQRHGEHLALKLHRLAGGPSQALDALKGEFELLAQLSHPNLARVFDFGHVGELAAFFTEGLVPGVRLDRTELRPDDPAAMPVWSQLCRALEYLHSRGILHRDLKPSNVLVDLARGHATLLDFGVARMFGADASGRLTGTYAYMAPEAIAGGPVDARSDLYSLGVTLYQLAAGCRPFAGSRTEVLEGHLFDAPPPLDRASVRPEVADVVERLLAKEPGDRFASAAELLDALAVANGMRASEAPREDLASYVLSARFVGRGEELLSRLLEELATRHRGTFVIEGAAGSGKSRVLRETRQRVQLAGGQWVEVPRRRWGDDRPLLLDVARAVLTPWVSAALDEDDRASLARALPELRRRRDLLADPLDPARERRMRQHALARAVAIRFAERAGVLSIEDLHHAGDDQLETLAGLVTAMREQQVGCVVLLTSRPRDAVGQLVQATGAELRDCPRLGPDDSVKLVDSMFGRADLLDGTDLGEALRSSEHSALYVQESLRLALERGAIVRRAGRWEVADAVPALPLAEVLGGRVRALSRQSRRLALAAAVLGGHGTGAQIATVGGQPLRRSAPALRELVRAGVLEGERAQGGVLAYTMHDRFLDVVRATASGRQLAATHRRAGTMLRRVARADWRSLLPAAHHFARAGDTETAAGLCERAASEALRHGHPQQALTAVDRELRLRGPEAAPATLWLRRFDLAMRSGKLDSAEGALAALDARATALSPAEQIAADLRRARLAIRRGRTEEGRHLATETLRRSRSAGDAEHASELLLLLGDLDSDAGALSDAMRHYVDAVDEARSGGLPVVEGRARVGATLVATRVGDLATADEMARRALEALRDTSEPLLRSEALRALGNSRRERGDVAGALRAYRKAVRAARHAGGPEAEAKALNNLGTVAQWAGRAGEAVEALTRAIRLKRRVGALGSAALSETNLAAFYVCTGRLPEARELLDEVLSSAVEVPMVVRLLAASNLGDLDAASGDLDDATRRYREALELSREHSMPQQSVHLLTGLVRTLTMRGDPAALEEARSLVGRLEELTATGDLVESGRRFHTAAAMLADAEGDVDRMRRHAEAARASEEEQRMHFTDVFGTTLEARWIDALAAARAGDEAGAAKRVRLARRTLARLEKKLPDDGWRARFRRALPMHRAVARGDLDTPRGWTFRPSDFSSPT